MITFYVKPVICVDFTGIDCLGNLYYEGGTWNHLAQFTWLSLPWVSFLATLIMRKAELNELQVFSLFCLQMNKLL